MVTLWLALVVAANPHLELGRKLVDELKYEEAERELRLAKHVASSTPGERRDTFLLLGWVLAGLGKADECELAYRELLTFAPDAAPPADAPPKVAAAFRRAKEAVYPPDFVKLTQLPSLPNRIDLQLVDPWSRVDEVVLLESRDGAPFVARPLGANGRRYSGTLSAPPGAEEKWFVEARSKTVAVASLGAERQPFFFSNSEAAPSGPAATPAVSARARGTTWLPGWATLAVGVVALGVGTWAALSASSASAEAGRSGVAHDVTRLDNQALSLAWAAVFLFGGGALASVGGGLMVWLGR
ncbi:MAG: hypothetical protein IPJ65_11820 [Archangiaceae bacterium]|nr:hypothetical protein [Archangiaceae bacterium]